MKTKLYLFLWFTVLTIGAHSQVSVFKGTNIGINPARITESKTTAGDFLILYSGINSQGLLTYRNGAILNNSAVNLRSDGQELPLGLLEIRPNDFLLHGASYARTGNFTQSLVRLTNERLQWAKGVGICDDFTNVGFISGIALRDSFIYSIGSSRNTACGSPDMDFSAVKSNLQGNIVSQISFIPQNGPSTDGMFFLQPHQTRFYFGGFSTQAPCGGGNLQRPGLGFFDANLGTRRWWTYAGVGFDLNGVLYQAHPFPSNPNRMVCNVRFSPDECADAPFGIGLFVVDSVGNPISAVRFRTSVADDKIICRYSRLIPGDESVLLLGRITGSNGTSREFLMRTTPTGRILFAKVISPSNPGQRVTFEDFTVSGQNIIMVGKLQNNGEDNLVVLQTDLNGNFPANNGCLTATNINFSVENLRIVKTEHSLTETQNMNAANINYRLSKEQVSNVSCALCQAGDFAIQARVDSTCFNQCAGRISVQSSDSTAYTYLWSNGRTNASIGGLCPGTYRVTITKGGACSKDTSIIVGGTTPIRLSPETVNTCFGRCDGVLRMNPVGGESPLRFLWNTGATTSRIDSLCAGNYVITITDARGCLIEDTFVIRNNSLNFNLLVEDLDCTPPASGHLVIEILEGTMPYELSINGSDFSRSTPGLRLVYGQTYQIGVRDGNRCVLTKAVSVPDVSPIQLSLPQLQPIRYGDTIRLLPLLSGGDRQFTYFWSVKNQENMLSCIDCPQSNIKGVENDSIFLQVKDSIGCTAQAFTLLRIIESNQIYIPTAFSPNSDQKNDIFTVFGQPGTGQVLVMRIFGRWGELVYESSNFDVNDVSKGWDGTFRGKLASQGVYVYVIEMQFRSGRRELFKGNLHLLR